MNLKLMVFLVNFAFSSSSKIGIFNEKSATLPDALAQMSKNQVAKNGFYTLIDTLNNRKSHDFNNRLLKNLSNVACAVIESPNNRLNLNRRKRRFAITVIGHYEDYLKFSNILDETFLLHGHFIVAMIDGKFKDVEKIFAKARQSNIMNINIAYETDGITSIETYRPFTVNSCNDTTSVVLNKFIDGKFINDEGDFFTIKHNNLCGCPVLVATSNGSEPFVIVKYLDDGSVQLGGRDIKLIEQIAEKLNFTVVYSHIENDGFLHENGTAGGIMKRLLDNETEMIIADFWLKSNRLKVFKALTSYSCENVVFVVPVGTELESYEKIMIPLSQTTWLFLCGTIMCGVIVIKIIKRYPTEIRRFVFGSHVESPFFNLLVNLIGGVQPRLPRRNFARFILINFVLFTLVM